MYDSFGKLPHRPFRHVPMHIVYRLYGSIPMPELKRLREARKQLCAQSAAENWPEDRVDERFEESLEHALHHRSNGPYHLQNPRAAQLVIDTWKHVAVKRGLQLFAVCVMSNHVHVVARSATHRVIEPGPVMQSVKSYTARACHELLGTSGAFWSTSYFDRDVRPGKFSRVMWYLLNNPVQAGLVDHWEAWPHTYLDPGFSALFRRNDSTPQRDHRHYDSPGVPWA